MIYHEKSIYKVTYKQIPEGGAAMTRNGLEISVYGEDIATVERRFGETREDLNIYKGYEFKIIKIERK